MKQPRSPRMPRRWLVGAAFVAGLAATLAVCSWQPHALAQESADMAPSAGLVIQYGDGAVQEFCIEHTPGMTGIELLERSGLPTRVEVSSMGTTVCRIAEEGCADDAPCWCQCGTVGGPCTYWSYQVLQGNAWQFADVGAAERLVAPGDVDGWAWGPGSVDSGPDMPVRTFDDICSDVSAAEEEQAAARSPTSGAVGLVVAGIVVAALVALFWWARRA